MDAGDADRVVIVGSGAGGAVAAFALAKLGVRSVVLEVGKRYTAADYAFGTAAYELVDPFAPVLPRDAITGGVPQELDPTFSILAPDPAPFEPKTTRRFRTGPRVQRVKGVGGTTMHYEAQMARFPAWVFKTRTLMGYGEDWPLSAADLDPYNDQIEDMLDVAGDAATTAFPRSRPFPRAAHVPSCATVHMTRAAKGLGLTLAPQALAILAAPQGERAGCLRHGGCLRGCPTGAKGSMDVTFLRAAEATGRCTVLTGWRARRIELDKADRFQGVVVSTPDGVDVRVGGRACILAAGAVETPRLLLLSTDGRHPRGIGNDHDNVGRYYTETSIQAATGLLPSHLKTHQGVNVDNVLVDFLKSDGKRGYVGGITACATAGGALLTGPVKHALQMTNTWGQALHDEVARTFGGAIAVVASGEPSVSRDNRVDLDPVVKDDAGDAVPRLTHRLAQNDLKMLVHMHSVVNDLLGAAKADRVRNTLSSYTSGIGAEPRGTCRMGASDATAVTGKEGNVFGTRGLYVADASLFPAPGLPANPSQTIMALAWHVAERVAKG